MRGATRGAAGSLVLAILWLGSGPAAAYDFEVASTTIAQAYELRGPGGDVVLRRRRITESLSLGVYNLISPGPNRPSLRLLVRMRLDDDFGVPPDSTDPATLSQYVPGLDPYRLELVYGYLEGRDFLGRRLNFRLGRQMRVDPLGFYLFDGAQIQVRLPYSIALEAYGGLEVRGGYSWNPQRFEMDGVERLNRDGLDPRAYPTIQPLAAPPFVIAGSLESVGFMPLHGILTYRRVGAADRVNQERFGYGLDGTLPNGNLSGRAAFVYDLLRSRPSEISGGVMFRPIPMTEFGLDYLYAIPTFDADSIWNFFNLYPINEARLRAQIDVNSRLWAQIWAVARLFGNSPAPPPTSGLPPNAPVDTTVPAYGGGLGLVYRGPQYDGELRLHYEDGYGGLRSGVELRGAMLVDGARLRLELRGSVWDLHDPFRAELDGVLYQYVIGARYVIARPASLLVEYEHDINPIVGNRFRLVTVLDFRFFQ